jgi:hypothetical protein
MTHWFDGRLKRNVDIDITWHSSLDVQAYTIGDYTQVQIEIHYQQPVTDLMLTLAHELVHAKQYIRGEITGKTRAWYGKCHATTDYHQLPWEQEAYQQEAKLYQQYWENNDTKTN